MKSTESIKVTKEVKCRLENLKRGLNCKSLSEAVIILMNIKELLEKEE